MLDLRYIFQSKLNKACFQLDMANSVYKDLPRSPSSGKVLCGKAFAIVCNPKYDGCQLGFTSMVYKLFDKKAENTTHTGTRNK